MKLVQLLTKLVLEISTRSRYADVSEDAWLDVEELAAATLQLLEIGIEQGNTTDATVDSDSEITSFGVRWEG